MVDKALKESNSSKLEELRKQIDKEVYSIQDDRRQLSSMRLSGQKSDFVDKWGFMDKAPSSTTYKKPSRQAVLVNNMKGETSGQGMGGKGL